MSHPRNGSAVPRSRAIRRSICRSRRVNLLKRCCERTRTARHRALCERRRLRHAAAILLRQGDDIAPASAKRDDKAGQTRAKSELPDYCSGETAENRDLPPLLRGCKPLTPVYPSPPSEFSPRGESCLSRRCVRLVPRVQRL